MEEVIATIKLSFPRLTFLDSVGVLLVNFVPSNLSLTNGVAVLLPHEIRPGVGHMKQHFGRARIEQALLDSMISVLLQHHPTTPNGTRGVKKAIKDKLQYFAGHPDHANAQIERFNIA